MRQIILNSTKKYNVKPTKSSFAAALPESNRGNKMCISILLLFQWNQKIILKF